VSTSATKLYADYIAEQINREDQRKTSLETRGVAVVTTSGALATLLLGLAALSKKNQTSKGTFVLPDSSQGPLKWALILFTAAALGAVLTNFGVWLQWADPSGLRKVLDDDEKTPEDAEWDIAENRLAILKSLNSWNDKKGWALIAAMLCEVVAIGFIAVAVWMAL
jgi:hypothetical protein